MYANYREDKGVVSLVKRRKIQCLSLGAFFVRSYISSRIKMYNKILFSVYEARMHAWWLITLLLSEEGGIGGH